MIWIFVFSLVILLSAVIATVVRKTGTNLAWGKILGWVGVIAVVITVSIVVRSKMKETKERKAREERQARESRSRPIRLTWIMPEGETDAFGRAMHTVSVEIVTDDAVSFVANLNDVAGTGRTERVGALSLQKRGNDKMHGLWSNHKNGKSGDITLIRVSPNRWAGVMGGLIVKLEGG